MCSSYRVLRIGENLLITSTLLTVATNRKYDYTWYYFIVFRRRKRMNSVVASIKVWVRKVCMRLGLKNSRGCYPQNRPTAYCMEDGSVNGARFESRCKFVIRTKKPLATPRSVAGAPLWTDEVKAEMDRSAWHRISVELHTSLTDTELEHTIIRLIKARCYKEGTPAVETKIPAWPIYIAPLP